MENTEEAVVSKEITPEEVRKLRAAVTDMDAFSQHGLSEISSIARLALSRLETPDDNYSDDIAVALSAIYGRADEMMNNINYTAETVGCNYVDEEERRRHARRNAAWQASRDKVQP